MQAASLMWSYVFSFLPHFLSAMGKHSKGKHSTLVYTTVMVPSLSDVGQFNPVFN